MPLALPHLLVTRLIMPTIFGAKPMDPNTTLFFKKLAELLLARMEEYKASKAQVEKAAETVAALLPIDEPSGK